jgi:quercetin dioxygenase-like cupin family protein
MRQAIRITALAVTAVAFSGEVRSEERPGGQAAPDRPAWGIAVKSEIMTRSHELAWKNGPAALPAGARVAVLEGDPKTPNALFTIRLELPAGYLIPAHFHGADEHITVISGQFDMGVGDRLDFGKLEPCPAGSFMVMPAGTRHFALSREQTVIQVHAVGPWVLTYVNPTDDPRLQARK